MSKRDAHEHEVSLTFKYAYRPSLLRREAPLVSPHGSQTNLEGMSANPRPSVCSPTSLPLRQDAIFQSFPPPSPRRGSPKRSPFAGKSSRQSPPQQTLFMHSPRPSPRDSPRATPQKATPPADKEEVSWGSSETSSPLAFHIAQDSLLNRRYVSQSGAPVPLLDGGGSVKNPDSQNSNHPESIDQADSSPNKNGNDPLGKDAALLGHYPRPPQSSIETEIPSTRQNGSSASDGTNAASAEAALLRRRKTSGFFNFIRPPLTFPARGQNGKGFLNACIPRYYRKSASTTIVAASSSSDSSPNNRMNHKHQSPLAKTPTPVDLANSSTRSSTTKLHIHGPWRSKKGSNDTSPDGVRENAKNPNDICYVAGEAHRFRTPLESPQIPGTPPTPTAISPKTTSGARGKSPLPSYFDLRRQETSNTSPLSPGDRGFTLMPLSDTNLHRRKSSIQTHATRLPHFVKVPMFSRAAPFAQREDYGSYSTEATPSAASRRSSFPPRGWSNSNRSSTSKSDGRRASFGYRDHINFLTKPSGYSSVVGSSVKQPSNSDSSGARSGSLSSDQQRKECSDPSSSRKSSTGERKGSLGERRASKVIASLNFSRKDSTEKSVDDGKGNVQNSSESSSKMVHWRGAEVTEEEAKILDMLVGRHRLFSEMLMAPLDSSQSEASEKPPEPGEGPVSILRRPSWRRFASTIGSSPLSGLSEETGSSGKTPKPESGDGVPDIRELYAEALQQTLGIPVGVKKNRKRKEDIMENSPKLPPAVVDQMKPEDFITAPDDLGRADTALPFETDSGMSRSARTTTTTRTEYETEILSIAMLYGRVIKETAGTTSEPTGTPSVNTSARSPSRAPSLTVPERPSVGFITNALDERSQSDSLVSEFRRMSLNPESKSRRSSTLARLQKLANAVAGASEKMSKRSPTLSPSEPPEYIAKESKSRHQSLKMPSLSYAFPNIHGRDSSEGGGE
ncbi:hypothetical protein TWF694_004229 [Orbilia ellipsospora]|uniref:Uncharacterized protein n=1 Tax=Orbilia ellipsospora TaxID=2528407 RepID=A0AAV9WXF5_9PEZI